MTKFVDEIWILKVNRSLLFRCLGIVASSVLMWPSPLFLFANVSGMLQVMSWSSGLHGQHPMWRSEWLNLTWCSISIETYWNQVCCPLFCLMFSIWSYLGCLIPVWYISKSCIGACALMQKQGTPRICWIELPVGSCCYLGLLQQRNWGGNWLLTCGRNYRYILVTYWVVTGHVTSCAPKRAPFSKGLEATSMSYAAVVGCLGWFLPLNRWNNLSKAVDQRVKLISPKAFAHGAARRWQQVLELQAWIWKVWVWVKS